MSYTIYAKRRPISTAFVLDTTVFREGTWRCDALLDGIVACAGEMWGGRNNPIVLIEPDTDLPPDEWKQIEAADPDRVLAFAPLNDNWVHRFDARLMPWSITVDDHAAIEERKRDSAEHLWQWLNVSLRGLPTPPFAEYLRSYRRSKLLMLEFSVDCPLEIRRFFHRNFGSFSQWFDHRETVVRRIAWLEDVLSKIEVETVRITDLDSACAAIHSFAGCFFPPTIRDPLRFFAATEISAFGLNDGHGRRVYDTAYRLFIGDSLRDFSAYWNELRLCRCWGVPHQNALWVSTALIRSAPFVEALSAFVYDRSCQHSSGGRLIEVTSDTLSTSEVDEVASGLRAGRSRVRARIIDPATRKLRLQELLRDELNKPRVYGRLSSANSERLRIGERTETVTVTGPDMLAGDGSWAVDVQLDFGASDRFKTSRWWCLPRRSGSILARTIFRAPVRVNRHHLFAVEIERQTARYAPQKAPELHISLPDESHTVEQLLVTRNVSFDYDDVRKFQIAENQPVDRVQISDKGQNLRGLIEMFGSFWTAEDFCSRRFWREALATLAGQDARRCKALAEQIGNVIQGCLRGDGKKGEVSAKAKRVTLKVLPWVHGALEDAPVSYAELRDILNDVSSSQSADQVVHYRSGDALVHDHRLSVTEDEMRHGLNQLLARNVLRAGVIIRCAHCGIESWLHVDEVRQFNECSGCGNTRPIMVAMEWHYRLNSLMKRCVSARILAVLQALASIAQRSTTCFLYSPNLELYRPGDRKSWRELDVVCVSDGELIIGEVKDGAFDKHELERFADAAQIVRPDRAAIFIPYDRFETRAQQWFSELQSRLAPSGILTEIYQLPSI